MRSSRGLTYGAWILAIAAGSHCMPGGIVTIGGRTDFATMQPAAAPVNESPYDIVCLDQAELKRREDLSEDERRTLNPPFTFVDPAEYDGGCEVDGQSSVFFLLNLWPVTPRLDPSYAIGTAIQAREGDNLIHLHTWRETHYYSLLGRAVVWRVRGDVIRYRDVNLRSRRERQ